MTFTYRTGTLSNLTHEQLGKELDSHLPRLYDAHNALNGIAIKGPILNGGFSVMGDVTTVTGSKLGIVTGLANVLSVTASVNNGATASAYTVSARPSQTVRGAIDLFLWQPTSAGVTTPIAATAAVPVHWFATGTSKVST